MIELVTPFPLRYCKPLWNILLEYPLSNFDDGGLWNPEQLPEDIGRREKMGHQIHAVIHGGQFVGVVGYEQISQSLGSFRGICLAKSVHGTGVAREAVGMVLDKAFEAGTKVVWAEVFQDNFRCLAFLKKMGATDIAYEPEPRRRQTKLIKMKMVGIHAHNFYENRGRGARQEHRDQQPQSLQGSV